MTTENTVRDHYSRDDLESVVLDALRDSGVDVAQRITARVGLDALVTFDLGSATDMPVFGDGFAARIGNNIGATMAGTLGAILLVARAA